MVFRKYIYFLISGILVFGLSCRKNVKPSVRYTITGRIASYACNSYTCSSLNSSIHLRRSEPVLQLFDVCSGSFTLTYQNYTGTDSEASLDFIYNQTPNGFYVRSIRRIQPNLSMDLGLIDIFPNSYYCVRVKSLTPKTNADTLVFYDRPILSANGNITGFYSIAGPFSQDTLLFGYNTGNNDDNPSDPYQLINYDIALNHKNYKVQKNMLKCNAVKDTMVITLP